MAARAPQSQPPLSQELDARFSVFLNPIRDLTKNWEVDIAKYLEEYLEELAGVRLSLDGGNTSMNFAEAAMLIQGSVTIYSKKVDFLWQMVLKTLDLLSSRRHLETGGDGVEVGGTGGGGGRKGRLELALSFSCVDSIQMSTNIELQEDDDSDSRRKSVKFLPSTPLNLVEKEIEKSQNRISLLLRNNEMLGAKDDFRLTRSYLTPKGMLHLEVPGEMLEAALALGSQTEEPSGAANIPEQVDQPPPLEDHAPPDMLPPADQPPSEDDPQEEDHSPCEDDSVPPAEDESLLEEDHLPPAEDQPPSAEDPPAPPEEPPPQAPDPGPQHKNNNNNNSPIDITKQRYGLRKRNKDDKDVIATLKLTDKLKPFDPNADCPPKETTKGRPLTCAHSLPLSSPLREQEKEESEKQESGIQELYSFGGVYHG
ncbi:hypothetical protein O3P69_017087 [Scylla paramamosain]|uniref:Condensin II complex subunit H2 N-terminal domain-containing protein n=1 Tax=Scylla paramamosain TaxID=85552 RepID=A0AAW0TTR0_SCYPA